MNPSIVASRYAKSLLNLSLERKELEDVQKDMALVFNTIKANKDLSVLLKSPIIRPDKKLAVLTAIFTDSIGKLALEFMKILTKKKREKYLLEIAFSFQSQYKRHKNITTAKFSSAIKMDASMREKVLAIIKKTNSGEVDLVEVIDEDLIGGFVLRIDDTQIDASVQNSLNNLHKKFSENPYVKEI